MLTYEFIILDFIQKARTGFGDIIMPLISLIGSKGITWIVFSILLCFSPKYRKFGILMMIALLLDLILCNIILKPLIARERPFDLRTVELLVTPPRDYSFPSGHTAAAFSVSFALLFGKCKLWIPMMIIAVLIAFSRLYLYVHFPTDVLGGIILGCFIGVASNYLYLKSVR